MTANTPDLRSPGEYPQEPQVRLRPLCAILHSDGYPHDHHGCILPDGHDGPHEFVTDRGEHWQWETDWGCTCEHCMQAEGDYCTTYWRRS